jgi:hypothetical protein
VKCGKTFNAHHINQQYCSRQCSNPTINLKICPKCKKSFKPEHKEQQYCSRNCYEVAVCWFSDSDSATSNQNIERTINEPVIHEHPISRNPQNIQFHQVLEQNKKVELEKLGDSPKSKFYRCMLCLSYHPKDKALHTTVYNEKDIIRHFEVNHAKHLNRWREHTREV